MQNRKSRKFVSTVKTSTSGKVTAQLAESKSPSACPAGVSFRTKIAISATAICGIALTAAYWFTRQSDASPYRSTCPNPPFPINAADLDFRIADQFNDIYELIERIRQPTASALFTGAMLHLKEAITKEMPCVFSAAVYDWLAKPISIAVAKDEMFERIGAEDARTFSMPKDGRFIGGQMLFKCPGKPHKLRQALHNEAFHLICFQANSAKTIVGKLVGLPFLNQLGQIDLELRKKYIDAINEFKKNLDLISSIVNKPSKLTSFEREKLKIANEALHDYQPLISGSILSKPNFYHWTTSLNKKLIVGQIIPKELAKAINKDRAIVIESIQELPNGNFEILHSRYGKSNAEIFATDYQALNKRLSYQPGYKNVDEDIILAEMGSDINMLSLRAMKYFAPGFCEYMGEYIGVGKDKYCEAMTPKTR